MKKYILLLSLILGSILSYGQTYAPVGNSNQRALIGGRYFYRTSLGATGFAYWYTKEQIDSLIGLNPVLTFSNGLTKTGNNVTLGGDYTSNIIIGNFTNKSLLYLSSAEMVLNFGGYALPKSSFVNLLESSATIQAKGNTPDKRISLELNSTDGLDQKAQIVDNIDNKGLYGASNYFRNYNPATDSLLYAQYGGVEKLVDSAIASIPEAPVTSVNGMTGAVNVTNITGNAGSATSIGGQVVNFDAFGTSLTWLTGLDGVSGIKPFNSDQVKTFLGVNENTSSSTIVQRTSGGDINANNFIGNASSATLWGNASANFSGYGTGDIGFLTGGDASNVVRSWQAPAIKTFLGMPTGGETLQSVADRGNSYIAAEAYLSLTSNNPSGKRFDIHSSSVGDFRVTNATDNVLGLLIKSNGNTGVKNDNPTEALEINGNAKADNFIGNLKGGFYADNGTSVIEATQIGQDISLTDVTGGRSISISGTSGNAIQWKGETLATSSKASGDFVIYNGTNWINKSITATAPLSWNASTSNMSINLSAYQTTGNLASVVSASTTSYPSNTAVINYNAANYAKQGGNSWGANMVIGTNDANDVKFIRNGFETLVLSNTATFNAPIAAPNLSSGTYTPTLTDVNNSSSTTSLPAHYIRVGNEVTVTGRIGATSTAAGTMQIAISLPIASALTTTEDASGFGQSNSPIRPLEIYYRIASNAVVLETVTTGTVGANYRYQFTYTIK